MLSLGVVLQPDSSLKAKQGDLVWQQELVTIPTGQFGFTVIQFRAAGRAL